MTVDVRADRELGWTRADTVRTTIAVAVAAVLLGLAWYLSATEGEGAGGSNAALMLLVGAGLGILFERGRYCFFWVGSTDQCTALGFEISADEAGHFNGRNFWNTDAPVPAGLNGWGWKSSHIQGTETALRASPDHVTSFAAGALATWHGWPRRRSGR
ncbi:hypothetical protein LTH96_03240 [Nesterenkonia sp. LB17]|uniref:hypothetical protein n=1 Tax=Nesterenkonia sp. LB17 TaxID=2901230 RepID=UPI001F4CF120|nr:hypothetical protein [Nesterenkonia sp. LB17]MCH8564758.1 hypothetical protein [Nesterenkonia sp. LB17]